MAGEMTNFVLSIAFSCLCTSLHTSGIFLIQLIKKDPTNLLSRKRPWTTVYIIFSNNVKNHSKSNWHISYTGFSSALYIAAYSAQCAVCKVRCHCIFYGPGIRYSDIFGAPGIRYSVIIKLPCALLQTGHLETVHAPVADTVAYFADLDAPVVDTVTYFGGNHRSRVWKSLKLKKVYFPRTRTSWDKYMFNRILFFKV